MNEWACKYHCKQRLEDELRANNAAYAKFMTHECPLASNGDEISHNALQKDELSAVKIKILDCDLLRTIIGPIPGGGPCDAIIAFFC